MIFRYNQFYLCSLNEVRIGGSISLNENDELRIHILIPDSAGCHHMTDCARKGEIMEETWQKVRTANLKKPLSLQVFEGSRQ